MASCYKALLAMCAALMLTSCGDFRDTAESGGSEQRESRTIELDTSEKVRVDLRMPAGELQVRGGADKLMEGNFTYNLAAWKPDVRYSATGSTGELRVEQHGPSSGRGNARNRWDLKLNRKVPLDIRAELGAGEARLDLGSLTLRNLEVQMGAGTLEVDLRGTPDQDYSVRIRGGVGEATVRLPRDVGISAVASGGLGDISVRGLRKTGDQYVNYAYEHATRRIRLDIQGGVGSIRLIAD